MGYLHFFNLRLLIEQYGTLAFAETGTGLGFGVYHATQFPFQFIASIDIVAAEVQRIAPAFKSDKRVRLLVGKSTDFLRELLPQVKVPIVFWLDAHFPGEFSGKAKAYDDEQDEKIRLPLEEELLLIKELRPEGRDVILIDDLRIYERDNFEWGNLDQQGLAHVARYDSKFLYSTFEQTHSAQRFLEHTGYLALLPKTPASSLQSPP